MAERDKETETNNDTKQTTHFVLLPVLTHQGCLSRFASSLSCGV